MKIKKIENYFEIFTKRKSEIDLSEYRVEICPKCKQISPYNGGEYALHTCKNKECSFSGKESELISVINDFQLKKDLSELEEFILKSRRKIRTYKRDLLSKKRLPLKNHPNHS